MGLFSKRKLLPSQEKIYNQAFRAEVKKITVQQNKHLVERLKMKARSDAAKAAMPKTGRIIGGLVAFGNVANAGLKRLPPIDPDKLAAAVTGVPVKKKGPQ